MGGAAVQKWLFFRKTFYRAFSDSESTVQKSPTITCVRQMNQNSQSCRNSHQISISRWAQESNHWWGLSWGRCWSANPTNHLSAALDNSATRLTHVIGVPHYIFRLVNAWMRKLGFPLQLKPIWVRKTNRFRKLTSLLKCCITENEHSCSQSKL